MADNKITEKTEKELAFEYGEEKAETLFKYLEMVLERNEHINLTAVKDWDEAVQKHIVDSLLASALPEYKEAKSILDVGTGAGFPGVPLAITSPEKEFTLMDATMKRLRVIDEFAGVLQIENVQTLHARAEEIARKKEYAGAYDLCVSRAVANLNTLIGWTLPFVRKGGSFIAYKGDSFEEELKAAEKTLKKLGGRVDRIVQCPVSAEEISGHVLVVINKE